MGVPAAGIRQHEDLRAVDIELLRTRALDACGAGTVFGVLQDERQDGTPEGHTHEGDDLWTKVRDLPIEDLPPGDVFGRLEHVDPGRGARNEVRDPQPELGQPDVVFMREGLRRQARLPQQFPEAVRRAREVMAGNRGSHAGVDADEEQLDPWRDAILQPQVFPAWGVRIGRHAMAIQRRAVPLQLRRPRA